ncbi:helix-turn-helix domain-containing protein [Arthrobacter sp. E3]|uniref:helix-turn-helix domain-containing protein n=1 Tax=Arthrobacter sp. E3 TaxID=517402 RepID=UPI001A94C63A|nr:helix-turn-helix domain-containing protein [Arthrobacter sp. E3]
MTAQPPLPMAPIAVSHLGAAVSLLENEEGGKVFIHGELAYVWGPGDVVTRRFAVVSLLELKAAVAEEIAAVFNVGVMTLYRWRKQLARQGVTGLTLGQRGPKGPSRLSESLIAEIVVLRESGMSLQAVGDAVGVSEFSVRRALTMVKERSTARAETVTATVPAPEKTVSAPALVQPELWQEETTTLPVLPAPADRGTERAAARAGQLVCAAPVFAPAGKVPLVGLFLALPALERTGLLECATTVFGALPDGFYGLETILQDAVLRALLGESRAEGATRINPTDLGRVLGLDRAPEVKTIRRKTSLLAESGTAEEFLTALAKHHLNPNTSTGDAEDGGLLAVLYVDGHVRAYQGSKKIAKVHSTRLKFPTPATEETWVSDSHGAPVFVVMAEPGTALTKELRTLLPTLRNIIGDDRRVLVGFDRGGWSPALFAHMEAAGFDVLTWRKGKTGDIPEDQFTEATHPDEHDETRTWLAADTILDLPLATTAATGEVFRMRQISRIVPARAGATRQIHILTTNHQMGAGEVIHRMGSRWRQENYFRYARMHFDLDSHDTYGSTDDNPERSVPNPAKREAYKHVLTARAHYHHVLAETDAAMLALRTPAHGAGDITVTNAMHNALNAPLFTAEATLDAAEAAHRAIPARLPLGDLNPGQQVLDTQVKLITHGIRMAAYNTMMTLAREIRTNTGYARAADEAHTLIRSVLSASGDIDTTTDGYLTIRLNPLPTARATKAISELCEHLTTTQTRYPGTELILRYTIKNKKPTNKN